MICPVCKGIGSIPGFLLGSIKTCTSCHGKGTIGETLKNEFLEERIIVLEKLVLDHQKFIESLTDMVEKLTKVSLQSYDRI